MQRLIRRAAERLREAGDERQHQDVPDLDDAADTSSSASVARRRHLDVLRRQQRPPAIVAIGEHAADEREQDDRQLLQERVEAEVERPSPVSERTSQFCATICIQVPMLERAGAESTARGSRDR